MDTRIWIYHFHIMKCFFSTLKSHENPQVAQGQGSQRISSQGCGWGALTWEERPGCLWQVVPFSLSVTIHDSEVAVSS